MGEIVAGLGVAGWLITLSAFDFRQRRLPNWLTLPGAAVILVGALLGGHGPGAALGAGALFGVYATVHLAAPSAMGAGDVKLALGLGGLTGAFGAEVWVLAALGASTLTVLAGLWRFARRRDLVIAHGPPMCAAAALAVGTALA
ncbi:A24 family peptidase [Mycolicibacterium vaccae]|uniref:A24 family peptidase n=1 Tax=Mycolicibacterium vaccae TaxID=1810 RepID=UPI003CF8F846